MPLNGARMRRWSEQSFLYLSAALTNKFMQKNIQAQETNTQNLRLILAPALLYLDQMGESFPGNSPAKEKDKKLTLVNL
jgi:hypothetical protein